MPSGGHAFSGRAPDPTALRRERPSDKLTWLTLYPRLGDTPPWPLAGESTKPEDAMWARLWATPQATQWEANNYHDEVAAYVRTFCEATKPDASPAMRTLMLRQMEGLGLSAAGLARLRWRIATEPVAAPEVKRPNGSRRTAAQRSRFDVIIGDKSA